MPPDVDMLMDDTIIVGGPTSSGDVIPATPPPPDAIPPSSQIALPSTEDPGSPIDPSVSFKTEANDDRVEAAIIPSSLTPPPSTQLNPAVDASTNSAYLPASQRPALFSPPTTVQPARRPAAALPAEYVAPTPQEVRDAPPDALRAMVQDGLAENSRLKMEAAHYKLQLNLMSLQAGEDAKRAAVEHDMARREVEALRDGEHARQARREASAATESARGKYLQARGMYEEAAGEAERLGDRLRLAKKVIQQQEDDICRLRDDRHQLRIRIRENREHFNLLCSPGGIFHGVTPRQGQGQGQQRAPTPRGTPRARPEAQHRFDALIQVLSQEDNSAPSTPLSGGRPAARPASKHTRGVQSLSSLPTTPTAPKSGGGLLPSVQLAPRTEPPRRVAGRRLLPDSPRREEGSSRSRESTISVPENGAGNEELARQALASVQKASSSLSRLSGAGAGEGEDVGASQGSAAAEAASEMLRRDTGFGYAGEKRRAGEGEREAEAKRARVEERLGLGIRY